MSTDHIEVVTTARHSRDIIQDIIAKHDCVALDCEGVALGPRGKLTLLQLATPDHRVYLFDILVCQEMLRVSRGLRDLLSSDTIVKMIHACDRDSAALYHQFDIPLRNVHDTQVMSCLWQDEVDDVTFPKRHNLNEIAERYGGKVNEVKGVFGERIKYERELWAQRPLTREMISYAASDVLALVPEVYNEQKRLLESKQLTALFQERCEEAVLSRYEHEKQRIIRVRNDRENVKVRAECARIVRKYGSGVQLTQLDETEREVIKHIRWEEDGTFVGIPPELIPLRRQVILSSLDRIGEELKDRESFRGKENVVFFLLNQHSTHPDTDIRDRALQLKKTYDDLLHPSGGQGQGRGGRGRGRGRGRGEGRPGYQRGRVPSGDETR